MNNYYIGENAICFCLLVNLKHSDKLFIGKEFTSNLHSVNLVYKSWFHPYIQEEDGCLVMKGGKKILGCLPHGKKSLANTKKTSLLQTFLLKRGRLGSLEGMMGSGVDMHSNITISFTP